MSTMVLIFAVIVLLACAGLAAVGYVLACGLEADDVRGHVDGFDA